MHLLSQGSPDWKVMVQNGQDEGPVTKLGFNMTMLCDSGICDINKMTFGRKSSD